MEHGQELDKIKSGVELSAKKLEEISKSIQSLSGLSKLQDSLNEFQKDNALNRIETKIDILAQTDYSELFNFSLDTLKEDLTEKNNVITQKLNFVEELISHFSDNSEKDIITNIACLDTKLDELLEKASFQSEDGGENPDTEIIKSKINYISTKLNEYNQLVENQLSDKTELLADLNFLKENFYKINEKFSEITLLIRTNTAENDELNNRFESNLTQFNNGFNNIYDQFNSLENTFKSSFADFKVCIQDIYDQFSTIDTRSDIDQVKFYVQTFNNKMTSISDILESLKRNNFTIKVENNTELLKENHQIVNEKLNFLLEETKSFSEKMSDEFSSFVSPLSTAIEVTNGLKENIEQILSTDTVKVQEEASLLLDKFENIYKNSEDNLEMLFMASKQFYDKLEAVKTEFGNVSYETNSKMGDFIERAETLEVKLLNNITNAEEAINSLKNISSFTENQINGTSENINSLKSNVNNLLDNFNSLKNDVVDINSKLNKLIINEGDVSAIINSSFSGIKESISETLELNAKNNNQFGEKFIKKLSDELKVFSKKFEKIDENSSKNIELTEDVKNALVYMAEWFDSAGKMLEENNKNLKKSSFEIEKTETLIRRTEENISEQIKRLSDKLNRFEIRMESVEGKIEKLHDQYSNREVMHLLADILEKVELSNERSKANEVIISRLEALEEKITDAEGKKASKNRKVLSDSTT